MMFCLQLIQVKLFHVVMIDKLKFGKILCNLFFVLEMEKIKQ